MNDEINLLHVC